MRIAVAMSGGVDSSVAAYLLHQQGYDVVGMSMHLYNLDLPDTHKFDTCCSLEDLDQARRVADDLGFAHFTIDYTVSFGQAVVQPFIDAYAQGQTPNPCVLCNDRVKFRPLMEHAQRLGCTHLATGHYAKLITAGDQVKMLRAKDHRKDQTYFLFSLEQEQLRKTLFPLGDLTKDEVRQIARDAGIVTANKPESQDICFIPDGNIGQFLRDEIDQVRSGNIINTSGEILGQHNGIHQYTIGQRKGLGVSAPQPLYVSEIRAYTAEVVVSTIDQLKKSAAHVRDVRWLAGMPKEPIEADVQVRYRSKPLRASIVADGSGATVRFLEEQEVISPGQAAVFYAGDEVLGGGWIAAALQ